MSAASRTCSMTSSRCEAEALHAGILGQQVVHELAQGPRALAVNDAQVREIGEDGVIESFDQNGLGLVGSEPAQRDLRGARRQLLPSARRARRPRRASGSSRRLVAFTERIQ